MNKYGEIALIAVKALQKPNVITPMFAWQEAAKVIYPKSPTSQVKNCPKSSFLGLCEENRVRGVHPGKYTSSVKSKNYAIAAADLLANSSNLTAVELWLKVIEPDIGKASNYRMDVVLALFNAGYLK